MEIIKQFADIVLHLDKHLAVIIAQYGTLTYLILFTIIFCETGLVVTPFLPGDSLLFAAGALSAATGVMKIHYLWLALVSASILGDNINYFVGRFLGQKIIDSKKIKIIKQEHLDKTHEFYEKHGGKTIIIAKYMPIIRTFAPFVAGVGKMTYPRFLAFNVTAGILWVSLFTLGGYFFGNLPIVQKNFSIVIFAIIAISFLPAVIEFMKHRIKSVKEKEKAMLREMAPAENYKAAEKDRNGISGQDTITEMAAADAE